MDKKIKISLDLQDLRKAISEVKLQIKFLNDNSIKLFDERNLKSTKQEIENIKKLHIESFNLISKGIGFGAGFLTNQLIGGASAYERSLQARILLSRRGVSQNQGFRPELANIGMSPEQQRQFLLAGTQSFGARATNQGGAGIAQTLGAAGRLFGVDPMMLMGLSNSFRANVGVGGAQKEIIKLLSSGISSDIKDAIGPYLETAANMLVSLNRDGFALDDQALSALKTTIRSTGMGAEKSERLLMNIDQSVRTSSGVRNAFFQAAAARAGLGSGILGGTQFAVGAGGLFGLDQSKLQFLSPELRRGVGEIMGGQSQYTQNFAKSIVGMIDSLVPKEMKGPHGAAQRTAALAGYAQNVFGGNPAQALATYSIAEKLASSRTVTKEEHKKFQEAVNDVLMGPKGPEEEIVANTAKLATINEKIGQAEMPVLMAIKEVLVEINKGVLWIINHVPGMTGFKPRGQQELLHEQFKDLGFSPENLKFFSREQLESERKYLMQESNKITKGRSPLLESIGHVIPSERERQMREDAHSKQLQADLLDHIKIISKTLGSMNQHTSEMKRSMNNKTSAVMGVRSPNKNQLIPQ